MPSGIKQSMTQIYVVFRNISIFFAQAALETLKKIRSTQELHSIIGQPADKLRRVSPFLST